MQTLADLWRRFLSAIKREWTRWLRAAFSLETLLVAAVVLLLWLFWT